MLADWRRLVRAGFLSGAFAWATALGLLAGVDSSQAFGQVAAIAPASKAQLIPHRAVYEMTLQDSTAGSNVANVRGRLVFDFNGSACDGYTLNTRLVTQTIDRDGKLTASDVRSSSWEQGNGGQFRFQSSQYLNQKLSEAVGGKAARKDSGQSIAVALDRPARAELKLGGKILFPTQHSLAILDAASEGRTVLQADLYDGSEKGDKVYETTTFIGKPTPPGPDRGQTPVKNGETLDSLTSWPVAISYFNQEQKADEGMPAYQLGFRLYANGVSRSLRIDYGSFSLSGELSRLDFHTPSDCSNRPPGVAARAKPAVALRRSAQAQRKPSGAHRAR